MKNKHQYLIAPLILSIIFLSSACVTSPYDGEFVASTIKFTGYATNPDTDVEINAFNKSTSNWDLIATTTTSSTATTIGSDTLYYFSHTVNIDTVPSWQCYWTGLCAFPAEGVYNAEFRLESAGIYLTSFEENGISCTLQKILDGKSWLASGYECRGPNSPIINLKMAIIW